MEVQAPDSSHDASTSASQSQIMANELQRGSVGTNFVGSAQWMFADSWPLARLNPIRWRHCASLQELVWSLQELRAVSRPLRMVLEPRCGRFGTDRIEKEFVNPQEAMQWLRSRYAFLEEDRTRGDQMAHERARADVGRPSWRKSAGRQGGTDEYVFGDVTRSVVRRVSLCAVANHDEQELLVSASTASTEGRDPAHQDEQELLVCASTASTEDRDPAHQDEQELFVSARTASTEDDDPRNSGTPNLGEVDIPHEEMAEGVAPTFEQNVQATEQPVPAAEQEAKITYMWADAGLLPGLAKANPLRWSPVMTPWQVVKDLDSFSCRDRPVKLKVEMPGHCEVKTLDDIDAALQWLRMEFNIIRTEHRCVVCLEADVSIMLVPCRHAVLCDDCAGPILAGSGTCPICRVHITNHARGHFTNDYVDLVHAMEARLERVQGATYEGMYDHVRPLMVTGALLGTGAAACFVLAPPAAPFLAGAALAIGYVPWFATTAAQFEQDQATGQGQLAAASSLFSREDLARPLTLIAKAVTMAVVAPLAALVFFVPYGLFAGVVRPATRGLVHALVRICAYAHVYVVRPTARNLATLARNLLDLLRATGNWGFEQAVILGNLLVECGRQVGHAVTTLAMHVHTMALRGAEMTYQNIFVPIGQGCRYVANATYTHVLCPIGRGASAVADAIDATARASYNNVLLPIIRTLQRRSRDLGWAIATGATHVYSYVLLPSGEAIILVLRRTAEGLLTAAETAYSYVLVPLYEKGLLPLGQGMLQGLRLLGRGLVLSAELLYANALLPLGYGTWAILRTLGTGAAMGLRAVGAVLQTLGSGAWVGLKALGTGLAWCASLTYQYFLLPCAAGVALVACGAWMGASFAAASVGRAISVGAHTVYGYVLRPSGRALYTAGVSTAQALYALGEALAVNISQGAHTVYVYFLGPAGRALYTAGAATAQALQTLGVALAQRCTECGHAVYAYVLLPSGEAVCVAVSATGSAVQAGARAGRDAVVAASASVQQAVQQTVSAMHSATTQRSSQA
eukprot:TRINITY_DN1644_c0_g1_i2.p1 TRINITY_DN1644_c0_g1~~TRINITY_DN1644_c0_g1_i2.p1  ORF type:complete len:1029 (+),score=113.64 TRINITY_DN1644_c0_g1_i2:128-3214(+)